MNAAMRAIADAESTGPSCILVSVMLESVVDYGPWQPALVCITVSLGPSSALLGHLPRIVCCRPFWWSTARPGSNVVLLGAVSVSVVRYRHVRRTFRYGYRHERPHAGGVLKPHYATVLPQQCSRERI